METIRKRDISMVDKSDVGSNWEKMHITIPVQKISKYRNEVEELGYQLLSVERGEKSEFIDSISF